MLQRLRSSLFIKVLSLAGLLLALMALVAGSAFFFRSAVEQRRVSLEIERQVLRAQEQQLRFRSERATDHADRADAAIGAVLDLIDRHGAGEPDVALGAEAGAYRAALAALVAAEKARGLMPDDGAEGRMRAAVHEIEAVATTDAARLAMLQARRVEKDFLLRGDSAYVLEHAAAVDALRATLGADASMLAAADGYGHEFAALAAAVADVDRQSATVQARADALALQAADRSARYGARAARAWTLLWLAVALAFTFGALLALRLARAITRPVVALDEAARAVASGALDVTVRVDTTDETGRLAASFNAMVRSVRDSRAALETEKRGVEARIEAAVADAEAERTYLSARVERMRQALRRFSSGDLGARLPEDPHPLVGPLYQGFNDAVDLFRDLMLRVRHVAEGAATASTGIRHATDGLADRLREQTRQTHEMAAAVEQMVTTLADSARTASEAAATAEASGTAAHDGGAVVGRTTESIRQIAALISDSAATVERLGASSRQIGDIAATISEIADQTNLLALNAAIEAARAGEQGRGFAVVADEVRRLAERTRTATAEIAATVRAVRAETDAAVSAMHRGTTGMDEGLRLAEAAGEALGGIVESTARTIDQVSRMAAAGEEQSVTSRQIAGAVEVITTVTARSSAEIDDIVGAVARLDDLGHRLQAHLARFDGHEVAA